MRPEIAADTGGEMGELHLQRRQLVEQAGVDHPHRRNHQRELPAEHPPEIVGIHMLPFDDVRQRMDEHIESEIGGGAPERTQCFTVQCLPLQLRADHHAGKAKLNGTALHLGCCF